MTTDFIDTNVLVYLITDDDPAKSARAEAVLGSGAKISVQVLNELASVARRKRRMEWRDVDDLLTRIRRRLDVVSLTVDSQQHGIELSARYRLSVYDGQIVGSALAAGCDILWSEDMQDGLIIDSQLAIRNPFATPA